MFVWTKCSHYGNILLAISLEPWNIYAGNVEKTVTCFRQTIS